MSGFEEDRDLYWDPFERPKAPEVKAPPPGKPRVDTWVVLDREQGHKLGTVRLFAHRDQYSAERVARFWPDDTGSGPVVLWNERTREVVY